MERFISIVAISFVGVAFWYIAGAIADVLTPKILAWIRRRKGGSGND